jgi:hypothetical protein
MAGALFAIGRAGAEDETDQAVRLDRQHRVDALMTLRKI